MLQKAIDLGTFGESLKDLDEGTIDQLIELVDKEKERIEQNPNVALYIAATIRTMIMEKIGGMLGQHLKRFFMSWKKFAGREQIPHILGAELTIAKAESGRVKFEKSIRGLTEARDSSTETIWKSLNEQLAKKHIPEKGISFSSEKEAVRDFLGTHIQGFIELAMRRAESLRKKLECFPLPVKGCEIIIGTKSEIHMTKEKTTISVSIYESAEDTFAFILQAILQENPSLKEGGAMTPAHKAGSLN